MQIEQIAEALSDRNLREVERKTGISYGTLRRIRNGKTKNPTYPVTIRLVDYLKQQVA